MRVRIIGFEELDDARFALIELLLQPIGSLARTVRPQFNGVNGNAIIGSMAHAVHHLGLVNLIASRFHHAAANDAHALEHAAALRHLFNAKHARLAIIARR